MRAVRVSVVLPVFNAVRTVGRAVRSVLDQEFRDFELVVVDDGSTDGSGDVVREVAAGDERVRLIQHAENLGVVAAANRGHSEAGGELVARMDADDWSHPERLGRQVAFLEAHPDCGLCGTGIAVRRLDGEETGGGFQRFETWINGLVTHEAMLRERFVETPLVQPSVMVRREVFEAAGGYRDIAWAEDYDLWLRLADAGVRFGKLEEVLLEWCDGETRLTRRDGRYAKERFLEAKAHFLARVAEVRERGVALCGAGENGKLMARLFGVEGVPVARFYEVHPRRIGKRIGGVPVASQEALPPTGEDAPVLISAVGLLGGRDQVRGWVREKGYVEGVDFYCVV